MRNLGFRSAVELVLLRWIQASDFQRSCWHSNALTGNTAMPESSYQNCLWDGRLQMSNVVFMTGFWAGSGSRKGEEEMTEERMKGHDDMF